MIEKEFKTKTDNGNITHLTKINDSEFITSSNDNSFKIWDKDLQGCRYTIYTHAALHTMAITGENGKLLISGYGDMDFIVIGLDQLNQNHIS